MSKALSEHIHVEMLAVFLNYFSIAVIKCHDQGNLEKEGTIGTYGSRGIRVQHCQDRECGRKPPENSGCFCELIAAPGDILSQQGHAY